MATFPGDTFSPETCGAHNACAASEAADRGAGGINAGVLVMTPSQQRFDAFTRYAERRAAELSATTDTNAARSIRLSLIGAAEQSFLREFYKDELNTDLAGPTQTAVAGRGSTGHWLDRALLPHMSCLG